MSDKLFGSVQLLCGFNGSDGATSFTDESSAARTATFVGNAQLDTAEKKWGTASALFDGTGDAISFPDSADFNLSSGNFCIEAWVKLNVAPGAQTDGLCFMSHYAATGNNRAWLFRYLNQTLDFRYNSNGTSSPGNQVISATWRPVMGRWYHVAFSRSGNTGRLFVDGVEIGSSLMTGVTIFDPSTPVRIGAFESGGSMAGSFNGWIDDARLTVGAARYTGNFTPPRGPFARAKALGVAGESAQPVITYRTQAGVTPSFSYVLRIPSGTVGSNLTNFPVMVRLEDLPDSLWDSIKSDGGDLRIRNSSGDLVPMDLVTIDRYERTGVLFFLASSILAASDNEWTISAGDHSLSRIPASDPLGRNAVWADYEVVYLFSGDLIDRTGNHNLTVQTGTPAFAPVALGAGGGLRITANLQLVALNQLAGSSTFTMASSGTFTDVSINRSFCAYQETFGTNDGRATIGVRQSTNRYSNWDTTNSWNDGATVSTNTPVRLHGIYNGATEKRLYVNGALSATDNTVSAVGASNDSFCVGEGGANSSYHLGDLGFVYLRLGVLSADWIAAEYLNLSDPGAFFGTSVESLWVGALT